MKKILSLLIVLLGVSLVIGCELVDSMFFWAGSVDVNDLNDFEGEAASSDAEVLDSAMYGTMTGVPLAAISPEVQKLFTVFAPRFTRLSASVAGKSIDETGTMEMDENGDLDYSVEFENENFGVTGLDATGKADIMIDVDEGTSVSSITAEASGEIEATLDAIADSPFNGAIVNAKAKGNGDYTVNMETYDTTVKGYTAIAINAGFSLDEFMYDSDGDLVNDSTYKGGKFLVSFRFIESVDYDSTEMEEMMTEENPAASVEAEITVKVYDNDGTLVHEKTYTAEEIYGAAEI